MYLDYPPNKIPHSKLKLHDRFEPAFVPSILDQDLKYTKPRRGKTKKITQVSTHFKENNIMSGEPFAKRRKVLQPAISSYTNHVIVNVLEHFSSFRIKTIAPQLMPGISKRNSFELILNDLFLNILNIKKQTKTWPQFFYEINTLLIKIFILFIISSHILNLFFLLVTHQSFHLT